MFKSIGEAGRDTIKTFVAVWKKPIFYRFLTFLFLIVMIRIVFYHMHYTFPKYGLRELGPGAKIGNLWSVLNPVMIVILTPLVAAFTGRISSYSMIAVGSSFAALPVFFLAMPREWFQTMADGWLGDLIGHTWLGLSGPVDPIYISITLFVFFFSIGEAIWSPRLYQYTAAIAPKGQEGTYMALSLLPYFVAKLGVGLMSGRMLERWCPSDGTLAQKHLISEYNVNATSFEGMNAEAAVPILGEKIGLTINEAGKLTQDGYYQVWEMLHQTYPRDSTTLWLWIAIMSLACPIGIILLRNVIRSREDDGVET
jgi:hypothetical protein